MGEHRRASGARPIQVCEASQVSRGKVVEQSQVGVSRVFQSKCVKVVGQLVKGGSVAGSSLSCPVVGLSSRWPVGGSLSPGLVLLSPLIFGQSSPGSPCVRYVKLSCWEHQSVNILHKLGGEHKSNKYPIESIQQQ